MACCISKDPDNAPAMQIGQLTAWANIHHVGLGQEFFSTEWLVSAQRVDRVANEKRQCFAFLILTWVRNKDKTVTEHIPES